MSKDCNPSLFRLRSDRLVALQLKAEAFLFGNSLASSFVRGASWSLAGTILARGLTFVATIIAARTLGNTTYGELGMIQSTLLLCGAFAGNGVGVSLTRQVAELRNRDLVRVSKNIAAGLQLATVLGGALGLALLSLSDWIGAWVLGAPHLVQGLRYGAILLVLTVIGGAQLGALYGLQEFRAVAMIQVLRASCVAAGLVAGSLYGLIEAVIGLIVGESVSVMFSAVVLHRVMDRSYVSIAYGKVDWLEFRHLWSFALPVLLSGIVMQPAVWFGNVTLVNQPMGYAKLGIFMAAEKWRELILFVPASLSQTVLSLLSNLHGTSDKKSYKKLFRLNLLIHLGLVIVPALGLTLVSQHAMSLFGAEFQQGWLTLSILATSAIPVVLNNVLGQVLQSGGSIWRRFSLDLLLAGIYALLVVSLIPLWQENGMALASLLAFSMTTAPLFVIVRGMIGNRVLAKKDM